MTQAPERIWTSPTNGSCHVGFSNPSMNYTTEYIRADLVPQWQPIETAPKDGTEILVFGPGQDGAYLAVYEYDGWWVAGPWDEAWTELVSPPTRWMPLPSPPGDV